MEGCLAMSLGRIFNAEAENTEARRDFWEASTRQNFLQLFFAPLCVLRSAISQHRRVLRRFFRSAEFIPLPQPHVLQRWFTRIGPKRNKFRAPLVAALLRYASALRQFLALNMLHRPAGVIGDQWLGIFGGPA